LKNELWGGEFWADGYYVGTVGEGGNWQVVERYVQKQGQPPEALRQLTRFSYPVVLPRGSLFFYDNADKIFIKLFKIKQLGNHNHMISEQKNKDDNRHSVKLLDPFVEQPR
jgi:REP element-mobilizing transposase RayT